MRRALFLVVLLALLAAAPAPTPAAPARSIVLERFDAQIDVGADGYLLVTETLQVRFTGSWNGIIRLIPVEYASGGSYGPAGPTHRLGLDLIGVTDDRGTALRFEIGREGRMRSFKIWVPDARDAVRTVVLRYRVGNALRFFDEHDELYWNVTGDEWEMPIEAASATITLPPKVTGLRALAFVGPRGSTEPGARVEVSGNSVQVLAQRPLRIKEGLTVVAGWDKNLVAAAAPPPAPTRAPAKSITLERFEAEVDVAEQGHILVTETMRLRFVGRWNGIERLIPVEYANKGFNYSLFLDPMGVTDERGTALRHEIKRQGHLRLFRIWVPGASDSVRTVVLRYRVRNALRYFDEHDELYWNVTGDEWEMPIEAASATISLPANVTGLRALAFTGGYGSTEQDASIDLSGNSVRVLAQRPLGVREGLTVVVGWDKGIVRQPTVLDKLGDFLLSNWPLFFPIGVFGVMYWLWHTRGRDPSLRPIAPQYDPPAGLTPAEVGTLIDNNPDMRDITATLVDLAVRGYLYIDETETQQLLGLWTGRDYTFELRKPPDQWRELKPHETSLLSGLFYDGSAGTDLNVSIAGFQFAVPLGGKPQAGGSASSPAGAQAGPPPGSKQGPLPRVTLSALENKFYKKLPGIRDAIYAQLLQRGYYDHRPDKVKKTYMTLAMVLGVGTFWGSGIVAGLLGQSGTAVWIAGVLSAGIIGFFGYYMPARTLKGAHALEGVLGFEEFLSRVESDRFERMVKTPQMFEKFLPFAMAFGVEKNWVRAFDDIFKQPPDWYRGGRFDTGFRPSHFVNNLSGMSSRASTALASAPRSSSGGSGFSSGGGFSGGGFGGGGGRGF